ncbi:MAG: YebC/PmpR family DNA-binding transcriptional regulator [Candidatus Pacebacteria bacterium]|nr:YebC/PmpR family DNA-binding transcriptional regulator [Candidatus Paceibacterota bacterium]
MSGHSHAKTIKHQKNITDQKRGQLFSKMARVISVAVKEGGANPETNTKLRMVIEQAKSQNMPRDNIDRAIQNALGPGSDEHLEEVSFEAFGPGGTAVIVEGITDNTNRTLGEIKQILNQHGGKLVGEGAVKWLFDRKGSITVDLKSQSEDLQNKEKLEMAAIEAGADDIKWEEDAFLEIYTKIETLDKTKTSLEKQGVKIDSAYLEWVPKEEISLDEKQKEACQKLFDALDENDAVQNVFSNLKM